MTGTGGSAGFVLQRARAHRLLLAAALLTVLLTTAVLATLAAYSGAIGDAALRHSLRDPRNAVDTALIVKADVPAERRTAADTAVREAAKRTFDGLPVTVRTLRRSGPYALPRSLQPPAERSGDPDLTFFAALDRTQVRFVAGRPPARTSGAVEVALPQAAARSLGLGPGESLTVTDRLGGPKVRVTVTGLYRPARTDAPYWKLDDLGGRGIKQSDFTTYGPLLADPGVLTGGTVSAGASAWLASADFSTLTTGRIDALREAARTENAALREQPALSGVTVATTALPDVLDRVDRSLLVSRSTLLIVALQLALLAACALLLVARLLSTERTGETRLLLARGASRRRIAGLAALEALLLAVPSVVCAPLLAGPLTRLLAGQGPLARIGLRLDVPAGGRVGVWLVAAGVALGCALAVTLPALTSSFASGRARALPSAIRAGADLGLLAVAAVAYWQLDRQTSGATGDDTRALGVDPLLVAAPALALLAGTVLTLRLLPPVARLAERRAAGGRGLTTALAGWQIARRPMRGAGPVLLLVLAVALGMLAIGQGSSWDRSQNDQADFRAGVPVRILAAGADGLGRTDEYAAVPGVREAAPAARSELALSGDRTATVLALDTAHAADALLMRSDLASEPVRPLLAGLGPQGKGASAGARVPAGTARLRLTTTLHNSAGPGTTADVTLTLQDRHGTPYRLPAGELPADGRRHTLGVDVPPGPLTLTGVALVLPQPIGRAERHRFVVDALTATDAEGAERRVPLPDAWTVTSASDAETSSPDERTKPTEPRLGTRSGPPTVEYGTGYVPAEDTWVLGSLTLRLRAAQPPPPAVTAVATDRFLASAGARAGQRVDLPFGGGTLPVRIVRSVQALPTTEEATGGTIVVDLRSVNRVLEARSGESVTPTEWWLRTAPGAAADVAAALRARPDMDPAQVVVRDEIAEQLRDDPFGAGPEAAFAAAAGVAAALAAVGFAVSSAGSLRERGAEFAVLRALGAPRRRLARTIAVEQGVLVALALLVGAALGTVLTRAVVPLIVLTSEATRPVPRVLVELPAGGIAVLLAAVALPPVLVTAALAVRRADPVASLREQGGE
ncbi:FtsX-like permease family protein [Streptomyces resistomycificus]|uniref:Peptide ABC transporter permease n=1 Tax=Streptomyces resistomycificus TaxID=67356 RepID=A0A0L8KT99_9ACTN|nr:FtsX-like permease family protein [Streptomyces resistomycificus]KOG29115.1 peptide ABC transporter permease [Streptomyces resistomycificus]KUN91035.1 peptide ABC transporter permease [Streptomyces resistomycificus]